MYLFIVSVCDGWEWLASSRRKKSVRIVSVTTYTQSSPQRWRHCLESHCWQTGAIITASIAQECENKQTPTYLWSLILFEFNIYEICVCNKKDLLVVGFDEHRVWMSRSRLDVMRTGPTYLWDSTKTQATKQIFIYNYIEQSQERVTLIHRHIEPYRVIDHYQYIIRTRGSRSENIKYWEEGRGCQS